MNAIAWIDGGAAVGKGAEKRILWALGAFALIVLLSLVSLFVLVKCSNAHMREAATLGDLERELAGTPDTICFDLSRYGPSPDWSYIAYPCYSHAAGALRWCYRISSRDPRSADGGPELKSTGADTVLSLLDVSNDDLDEQDGHYTEEVPFEANAEYRGVPLFVLDREFVVVGDRADGEGLGLKSFYGYPMGTRVGSVDYSFRLGHYQYNMHGEYALSPEQLAQGATREEARAQAHGEMRLLADSIIDRYGE